MAMKARPETLARWKWELGWDIPKRTARPLKKELRILVTMRKLGLKEISSSMELVDRPAWELIGFARPQNMAMSLRHMWEKGWFVRKRVMTEKYGMTYMYRLRFAAEDIINEGINHEDQVDFDPWP